MSTAQVQKRKKSDPKFAQFAQFARELAKSLLNDAVIVQLPLMQCYVFKVPLSQPYAYLEATITKMSLHSQTDLELYRSIEITLELRIYQWINYIPVIIGTAELSIEIEEDSIYNLRKFKVTLGKPKEVPLEAIQPIVHIFQKVRLVSPPPSETTQVIEIY